MKPIILCAAVAALTLAASAAWADQCSYKTSESRSVDPDQILLMMDAKTAVKTKLDDLHASFREVYYCKTPRDQIAMTCGEVKSGKTGKAYVKFLSGGRPDNTAWDGDGKAGFDSAWTRFCKP